MNFKFDDRGNISVTFALLLTIFILITGLLMWVVLGPVVDQFYLSAHSNEDMMTDSNLTSFDIIYAAFQHPLLALLFTVVLFVIIVATRTTDQSQEDDYNEF